MREVELDKVVDGLKHCIWRKQGYSSCDLCPYRYGSMECCSTEVLEDALALIEKQAEQLKEWSKYTGFLVAHGFFQDKEEKKLVKPVSVTTATVEYDPDTGRQVVTKKVMYYDGRQ